MMLKLQKFLPTVEGSRDTQAACGQALSHNKMTPLLSKPSLCVLESTSQLFHCCTVSSGIDSFFSGSEIHRYDTFSSTKNGACDIACRNYPFELLYCQHSGILLLCIQKASYSMNFTVGRTFYSFKHFECKINIFLRFSL